jgi:DNA topoisomerase-1
MATPEMTAELESDMDKIAAGETSKDEVVRISREMLHTTTTELEDKREDFAKQIWQGMDEDKFLGPCKVCAEAGRKCENGEPNRLRIIDLKGGKRMYGCEGWLRDDPESPDSCPVSGPLPGRFYELWRLEEVCSVCGERPRLTVKKRGPGRPWKLCLNDDCPTMVEMREKRAEREAAKEAQAAAKAAADAGGESEPADGDAGPAKPPAKGGGRRRPKKPAPTTARTKRARSST